MEVDAQGDQAMVCKRALGKTARHHALNDVIWRAMTSADIPALKEPSGLTRRECKRLYGLTLIPFQGGTPLVWDVTVTTSLAESYVDIAAIGAGLVAEQAANRKLSKYAELASDYILEPIAVKNLGSFDLYRSSFSSNLGNKIRASSGEDRETSVLFQRICVLIQRFNSVLLHDSFTKDGLDKWPSRLDFRPNFSFLTLGIYTSEGIKILLIIIIVVTPPRDSSPSAHYNQFLLGIIMMYSFAR